MMFSLLSHTSPTHQSISPHHPSQQKYHMLARPSTLVYLISLNSNSL